MTKKTSKKKGTNLLSGRFKAQRTAQVESAFEARTKQLETRARELDPTHIELLSLKSLRLDGGTQPRVATDRELIQTYAQRMRWSDELEQVVDLEGQPFDPIVFYDDGTGSHWLADGFHRVLAAQQLAIPRFQARRMDGDRHAAFVYSLGANATHGKRRTNADKRRAVERALKDETLRKMTDRRLARVCKVSNRLVSTVRSELEVGEVIPVEVELVKADGSIYERLESRPIRKKKTVEESVRPPEQRVRWLAESTPAMARPAPETPDGVLRRREGWRAWQVVMFATGRQSVAEWLLACEAPAELERVMMPYPEGLKELKEFDEEVRARLGVMIQGPWPVYVKDQDRIYAMWARSRERPVSTSTERIRQAGSLEVLGKALEPWEV